MIHSLESPLLIGGNIFNLFNFAFNVGTRFIASGIIPPAGKCIPHRCIKRKKWYNNKIYRLKSSREHDEWWVKNDEDKTIKKSLDLIIFLFSSFIILHSSLAFDESFRGGRTVLVPRYVERNESFLEALPVTRNWQHAASFKSSCLETVHFWKSSEKHWY